MPFSSLRQYGVTSFQTREKKTPGHSVIDPGFININIHGNGSTAGI